MASSASAAAALALPPVLAAWLRKHALEFDRKLAHVFTEEELLDGSAAACVVADMDGDEDDTDEVGQHLLQLVAAAEADGARVCRRLATLPTRWIAASAAQKRTAEEREREAARVEAAALGQKARCKPPPPSRPRYWMEFAGRLRRMVADLGSEADGLGAEAAAYFTPHSFRAFLPSAMTAAGAPLDMLSWLAAWRTKGAQTYSRTGASRTVRLQVKLASIARAHWGKKDPFVERENARRLADHLKKRGLAADRIRELSELVTAFPEGAGTSAAWDEDPIQVNPEESVGEVEGRPHEASAGGARSAASQPQKRQRGNSMQPMTITDTQVVTGDYIISGPL
jgi:pyruvate/2-oxoglutarate dehydrogenase complex dihydrolipoamide acyltransferase (E2) component